MKLRASFSHVSAFDAVSLYRNGMRLVLSCSLLFPVIAQAADVPEAPDAVEQELQILKQLAQQMLNRIDALERIQRAKKGLPLTALPATPTTPALPNTPAAPVAPLNSQQVPEPVVPAVVEVAPPPAIKITPKAFQFSGNTVFSDVELKAVLASDLEKEVDFLGLEEIAEKIKNFYRSKGYFLALALLPKQEIVDGTIKIEVLEGRLGKIRTKTPLPPGSTITESQFTGMITSRLKEGDLITEDSLERPLLQLRDLPGVDVRSTINPGVTLGTADIDLEILPLPAGKKIVPSFEFDNAGNRFAGEYRLTGKVALNGLLGIGDALSLNLTAGEAPLNLFGRIGYLLPVGLSGTRAGFNLSRLNYLLGKDFEALKVEGDATIAEVLAVMPFLRNKNYNLFGQVSLENKRLSDRQMAVSALRRDINSVKFQLSGDFRGASSVNTGTLDLAFSNLKFKGKMEFDEDQSNNGFQTAGGFTKINFSINRLQVLIPNYELSLALSGQLASKNLTSAEKFVLGGANRVRGYPAGEAGGDQGFVATGELRYSVPGFNFGNAKLALSTFVDYGVIARNRNTDIAPFSERNTSNRRNLYSIGFGFNISEANNFIFRSDIAFPRSGPSTTDTKAQSPRLLFQGIKLY